jgi:hypothetical protein
MRPRSVDRRLLLRLLTENELTHKQIAERVGCSPERVRQLELELLHRTGHQAQQERRERKLRENFGRNEFVKAVTRLGFKVEPKRARRDWFKRELYVNGKLCLLRRADEEVGHRGWYTAIRKPSQKAEVCVMELGRGRFLIIPMRKMPRSRTMFSLENPDAKRRTGKWQYYWREYVNNWAALGKANERNRRASGRGEMV